MTGPLKAKPHQASPAAPALTGPRPQSPTPASRSGTSDQPAPAGLAEDEVSFTLMGVTFDSQASPKRCMHVAL